MDDINHNFICGFVFGKRKNKIQSVVFGCILFTDGFSIVKKLPWGNFVIYGLAIGLAELTVRRALSQKFLLDSTLALETTKIDRTGLYCRYCTSYRFYHIGSIMAKMLFKQN